MNEASKNDDRPGRSEAISLAGAVLDAAGFGGSAHWTRTIERAWFVNLETFFEEAVRRTIRQSLPDATTESARRRPSVFRPSARRYRASPDVVVYDESRNVVAIGDAKYKELDGWPGQADVFELLAHASAYGTKRASLFYPADGSFSARHLGVSGDSCDVWSFGISFDNFTADIKSALQLMGLIKPAAEGA